MTDDNPLNLSPELLGLIVSLAHQASQIEVIADSDTDTRAKKLRSDLKGLESQIEKSRAAAKRPYLDAAKHIERLADVIFEQITPHIKRLDKLRLAWSDQFTRPMMFVGAPEVALGSPPPDLSGMVQAMPAEKPEIRVRETNDVEITDLALIPREFMVPDMVAIRDAVLRKGMIVPGVKVIVKRSVLE